MGGGRSGFSGGSTKKGERPSRHCISMITQVSEHRLEELCDCKSNRLGGFQSLSHRTFVCTIHRGFHLHKRDLW